MRKPGPFRLCASLLLLLTGGGNAPAQPAPAAPAKVQRQATAPAQASKALQSAQQALADGRFADAVAGADRVLHGQPASRDAAAVKISALLAQQQFDKALAAYDALVAALKAPDGTSLALVSRAELRRIAQQTPPDPVGTATALERLATNGDRDARAALERAAASQTSPSPEALAQLVSLARLGNTEAPKKLAALLGAAGSWEQKTAVIKALQDADARAQAASITPLLDDSQPQVRCAAALALGALQHATAVPKLQRMYKSDAKIVQLYAGVALKRLGQSSADDLLWQVLASDMSFARLAAAQAYQTSRSTQWVERIRDMLGDRDEGVRLQAAEAVACCNPAIARTALVSLLDSRNPLARADAARILEQKGLLDLTLARRLLGDPHQAVRLYAAAAALGQPHGPSH